MTEDAPREPVGRDADLERIRFGGDSRPMLHRANQLMDATRQARHERDALVAEVRALREAAIAVTEIAPLLSDEFCSRCPYCNGGEPEEYYHDEDFPHSEDCPWKRLEALVGEKP